MIRVLKTVIDENHIIGISPVFMQHRSPCLNECSLVRYYVDVYLTNYKIRLYGDWHAWHYKDRDSVVGVHSVMFRNHIGHLKNSIEKGDFTSLIEAMKKEDQESDSIIEKTMAELLKKREKRERLLKVVSKSRKKTKKPTAKKPTK